MGKRKSASLIKLVFYRSLVYEAQKKIDLPYEIYRTQFHPSITGRERNILREVLGKFYTFMQRWLSST